MLSGLTGGQGIDPEMARMLEGMGIDKIDPALLQMVTAQVQAMFASTGDEPFNVALATDTARKAVSSAGDQSTSPAAAAQVDQAAKVAEPWLDQVTSLVALGISTHAWSRAEWVDATMPTWRSLVEPVAEGVGRAISGAMRAQIEQMGEGALPEGILPAGMDPKALLGEMEPLLARMSGSMFGLQVGQAVGALAQETVSGTEMGLPLVGDQAVALLPTNIAAFAEGLEVDLEQVRLYLAVREAARVRLFSDVPWLGPQLLSAVSDYARNITIDTEAIESALSTIDPSDPEALRSALQGNLFRPQPTAAQRAALDRLETLLALAEGWVDHVTDRTTAQHLPQSAALAETIRRRRVGGAAQKTFAGLVGLELRPRRLRDAANLWAALESAGGAELRDGRWAHPDLAPTSADLDDVIGYVERATGEGAAGAEGAPEAVGAGLGDDLDSVLQGILEEADRERGTAPGSAVQDDRSDDEQQSGGDGDVGPTR